MDLNGNDGAAPTGHRAALGRQLALPLLHRESFPADGFVVAPSNQDAVAAVARIDAWPDRRLALWGDSGSGKTHLLHLWLGHCRAAGLDAGLLDGAAVGRLAPDAPLPEKGGGLAIDGLEAALADPEHLLHLLNRLAEAGLACLMASRTAPARLPVALPDLASRLRAIAALRIGPPEDDLLDALLGRLLAARQLAVTPDVVRWLRSRLPREPGALVSAVRALDQAALAEHAPVTASLAARVLPGL